MAVGMTLSDAITGINYALRGIDDDAPVAASDEYLYWVATLNRKKNELYHNPTIQWRANFLETAPNETGTVATVGTTALTGTSTHFTDYRVGDKITVSGETERTIATIPSDTSLTVTVAFSNTASAKTFTHKSIIATGVQTYSLHRSFISPSDQAYVLKTDGYRTYLDLIEPEARRTTRQEVFVSDENPQTLTFTRTLESTDPIIGGTLYVPGYFLPADVSEETDRLPVPDPNWLVLATAAEVAYNDIVYEDRAEGLNSRANNLYRQMVATNRRGTFGRPRTVPYNIVPIRGPRST